MQSIPKEYCVPATRLYATFRDRVNIVVAVARNVVSFAVLATSVTSPVAASTVYNPTLDNVSPEPVVVQYMEMFEAVMFR
jgi:hypothetical protein